MKHISQFLFILFLLTGGVTLSQTNTFPTTGNVGIGTLSPSSLLEVVGTVSLTGTTGVRSLNFNSGYVFNYNNNLFLHTTGGADQGLFLGELAGDNVISTSGVHNGNVGIGYSALHTLGETTGSVRAGNHNTAIGWRSLINLNGVTGMSADKNTMVGSRAGEWLSSGRENTGVGYNSFYNGDGVSAYIEGIGNTAIGGAVDVGDPIASFGVLGLVTSGDYNTVLGYGSGIRMETGSNNLILGDNAGINLVGDEEGEALRNTIIGSSAAAILVNGNDNIFIGQNANHSADVSNFLNIGSTIYGDLLNDEISIGSDLTPSMFNVGTTNQFQVSSTGRINNYNGIATLNNGVPAQVAVVNLANQTATIPASTVLYTSAAEDFYRVSYSGVITTAASYSSGAPASSSLSLRVKYNDPNLGSDVVAPPTNLEPMNSYSSNAVGGNFSGSMLIYVEAGSTITFKATYSSDPPAPATAPDANMAYTLRIVLEKL